MTRPTNRTLWPSSVVLALFAAAACGTSAHGNPPSTVPAHVQTAAYLVTPVQASADPKTFAPYLTWGYPLTSDFSKVYASGIKTVLYVNPLMPEPGNSYEFQRIQELDVAAKDCGGNPVRAYRGTS